MSVNREAKLITRLGKVLFPEYIRELAAACLFTERYQAAPLGFEKTPAGRRCVEEGLINEMGHLSEIGRSAVDRKGGVTLELVELLMAYQGKSEVFIGLGKEIEPIREELEALLAETDNLLLDQFWHPALAGTDSEELRWYIRRV